MPNFSENNIRDRDREREIHEISFGLLWYVMSFSVKNLVNNPKWLTWWFRMSQTEYRGNRLDSSTHQSTVRLHISSMQPLSALPWKQLFRRLTQGSMGLRTVEFHLPAALTLTMLRLTDNHLRQGNVKLNHKLESF